MQAQHLPWLEQDAVQGQVVLFTLSQDIEFSILPQFAVIQYKKANA
jgi:hypothetical protein